MPTSATMVVVSTQDRIVSAVLTGAVTALLGWALLAGLLVRSPAPSSRDPTIMTLIAPTPEKQPRTVSVKRHQQRKSGRASPPNLRSTATEVVAPPPIVPLPVPPPPIAVAPVANTGVQPTQGAAERAGPGFGAGGIGNGFGSGGYGDGDGDGWAEETPPRRIRDRLKRGDYPEEAAEAGIGGSVAVRFVVTVDGHVADCVVTGSSGSAVLDRATCPVLEKRYLYKPSRDGRGRPVASIIVMNFDWILEDVPAEAPRR